MIPIVMSERPLWAPWRLQYVTGSKDGECIFCVACRSAEDGQALVVDRGRSCVTMLNAFPYAPGHVMVAPCRHVGELTALEDEEMLEMMRMARAAVSALNGVMTPHGFNIGLNLGTVAGAGIADHLHLHVVPRWQGDTNFMPVLADTHVISQALESSRELLIEALRREGK
jgi:ATP adenylyltransferase